jgi:hypothetical protein
VRAPAHGTLSGSGASLPLHTGAEIHRGDSFSFVANDGQADSDPAEVSITVASTRNQPPVASTSASISTRTPGQRLHADGRRSRTATRSGSGSSADRVTGR